MKKPIKSMLFSKNLQVGDEVSLAGISAWEEKECPMCNPDGEGTMFQMDDLCEAHLFFQVVHELGDKKMIRVEQWKDGSAWRMGINWYSENDYEYICEQKYLGDCCRLVVKEYKL